MLARAAGNMKQNYLLKRDYSMESERIWFEKCGFFFCFSPESVRTRSDVFYLVPETTSTPESPVWFSTQPVPRDLLARMLRRVLLVEDVLQNLCV